MDEKQSNDQNQYQHSLGQKLRLAREKQSLSLEDVAKKLNIKKAWLNALEEDEFNFTSPAYLKGYVRCYSRLLNIHNDIPDLSQIENHSSNLYRFSTMSYKKPFSTANKSMKWISSGIILLLIILVMKW